MGWAARRVVGLNPIAADLGWSAVAGRDPNPERVYATLDESSARPRAGRRLRAGSATWWWAHLVLIVGLIATSAVLHRNVPGPPLSPAFASEPKFRQIWADQQGFSRHPRFDPAAIYRFADFRSDMSNQVDGVRRTWRPPHVSAVGSPCGGSAARPVGDSSSPTTSHRRRSSRGRPGSEALHSTSRIERRPVTR